MKRLLVTAVGLLLLAAFVSAQKTELTSDDIERACAWGQRERGKVMGLIIRDSQQGFAAALQVMNGYQGGTQSGFSLVLFTPTTWIAQASANAAKEYRPFDAGMVTEDMLKPVLRVLVNPSTPTFVSAPGMIGTSSVRHVVIRSADRRMVMQPISIEPFNLEAKNYVGGQAVFQGLRAEFRLDALAELRATDKSREFLVTVVGATGQERDFKIKTKHFAYMR